MSKDVHQSVTEQQQISEFETHEPIKNRKNAQTMINQQSTLNDIVQLNGQQITLNEVELISTNISQQTTTNHQVALNIMAEESKQIANMLQMMKERRKSDENVEAETALQHTTQIAEPLANQSTQQKHLFMSS